MKRQVLEAKFQYHATNFSYPTTECTLLSSCIEPSIYTARNLCRILGFIESGFSQVGVVPPAKLIICVPRALAVPQHCECKRRHASHTTDTALINRKRTTQYENRVDSVSQI